MFVAKGMNEYYESKGNVFCSWASTLDELAVRLEGNKKKYSGYQTYQLQETETNKVLEFRTFNDLFSFVESRSIM